MFLGPLHGFATAFVATAPDFSRGVIRLSPDYAELFSYLLSITHLSMKDGEFLQKNGLVAIRRLHPVRKGRKRLPNDPK